LPVRSPTIGEDRIAAVASAIVNRKLSDPASSKAANPVAMRTPMPAALKASGREFLDNVSTFRAVVNAFFFRTSARHLGYAA